jgi:hypothetical protein
MGTDARTGDVASLNRRLPALSCLRHQESLRAKREIAGRVEVCGLYSATGKSGDASPQSEIIMKLFPLLFAACLLASCATDQPELPPPTSDTAAYARTPHEFRDEMLSPKR